MSIETIFPITLVLATLFTTIVTGLLFGFAIIVMPGIKNMADREFIRAFQGMDGIIQNNHPLFVLFWGGSVLLLLVATVLGFGQLDTRERIILIAAILVYLFGVQLPTVTINVPLNNQLQSLDVDTMTAAQLKAARQNFENRWNFWNRNRTLLSMGVSLLLMVLVYVL